MLIFLFYEEECSQDTLGLLPGMEMRSGKGGEDLELMGRLEHRKGFIGRMKIHGTVSVGKQRACGRTRVW